MTACPKPRPHALEKKAVRAGLSAEDRSENGIVRKRSQGICEAMERVGRIYLRCPRRAAHIHHLLSGIGVRGIGQSRLAPHKQHLCGNCHSAIHQHVLIVEDGTRRAWADRVRYERVR
jgi:hypothetical protein